MRKAGYKTRTVVMAAAIAGAGTFALHPATAEDSGFWDVVRATRPAARLFAPAPGFGVVPVAPAGPRIVRLPPAEPAKATPPDPANRENPLAALLRDPTLRYGDIVMFPNGPRVFRGERGGDHSVHDFVSLAASKEVSPGTRKILLAMPVGENNAWSSQTASRTTTIARKLEDVETTGSIGKTVTVRTGRGDVRIVRVPE
jgi:hypothetical protein